MAHAVTTELSSSSAWYLHYLRDSKPRIKSTNDDLQNETTKDNDCASANELALENEANLRLLWLSPPTPVAMHVTKSMIVLHPPLKPNKQPRDANNNESQPWEPDPWSQADLANAASLLKTHAHQNNDILKDNLPRKMKSLRRMNRSQGLHASWNVFYERNQANFYKDRHYFEKEFPQEFQWLFGSHGGDLQNYTGTDFDCHSRTKSNTFAKSDCRKTKSSLFTWIEVGCGVGNALFPLVEQADMHLLQVLRQSQIQRQPKVKPAIPSFHFVGLDFSEVAIEILRKDARFRWYPTLSTFSSYNENGLGTGFVENKNFPQQRRRRKTQPWFAAAMMQGGCNGALRLDQYTPPPAVTVDALVWDLSSPLGPPHTLLQTNQTNPQSHPHHKAHILTCVFVLSAISPGPPMHRSIRNLAALVHPGGMVLFRDYGRHDEAQLKLAQSSGKLLCMDRHEHWYVKEDGTQCLYFDLDEVRDLFVKRRGWFEEVELVYLRRRYVNRKEGSWRRRVWVQGRFRRTHVPVSAWEGE